MTTAAPGRVVDGSSPAHSAVPAVVILILLGVFGTGVGLGLGTDMRGVSGVGPTGGVGQASRRSAPTGLGIPSLDLRARVVEVGLAGDGSIAAPPGDATGTAGWYGAGPSPGGPGTAVIVGHVDTEAEPAVFHQLDQVRPGELIEVTRRDRRVVTFAVGSVRRYPKTAFPVDLIFDGDPAPRLVLVTCGGDWLGGDSGYADNIIVFAGIA